MPCARGVWRPALVRSSGRTASEVACELAINPESLRNWVKKAAQEQAKPGRRPGRSPGGALSDAEREELKRVRRGLTDIMAWPAASIVRAELHAGAVTFPWQAKLPWNYSWLCQESAVAYSTTRGLATTHREAVPMVGRSPVTRAYPVLIADTSMLLS
jgi:transposase-like protein